MRPDRAVQGGVKLVPTTESRRPAWWPSFSSPLRSTALTARLGLVLLACFSVCFVTGVLSHYQYEPWSWLPEPAAPKVLYRVTQGLHIATGVATIPVVLVKLWSVYPNLFRWPTVRSVKHAVERLSVFVLVSVVLLQLATGFLNTLDWYPWPWDFRTVHYCLAYVLVGSILLHVGIKLPDIVYGLKAKLATADVLTELSWDENPVSHSNAGEVAPPETPALSRRGVLVASGLGVLTIIATTVGQTVTPLSRLGLLSTRQASRALQGVPVNGTAEETRVAAAAMSPSYRLEVVGPRSFALGLDELERLADTEASLPIACVEGWSVGADWRGIPLLSLVERAGGDANSGVRVVSLQAEGPFRDSTLKGPQVSAALLATHLNGERLHLDHGYPVRLISPNRPGVLNTKWLGRIEVDAAESD